MSGRGGAGTKEQFGPGQPRKIHIPRVLPERLSTAGRTAPACSTSFRLWRLRPPGPTVPVVGLHTHGLFVRRPVQAEQRRRVRSLNRGEHENAPAGEHDRVGNTVRPGGTPQVLAKGWEPNPSTAATHDDGPVNICGPGTKNRPHATKGGEEAGPRTGAAPQSTHDHDRYLFRGDPTRLGRT